MKKILNIGDDFYRNCGCLPFLIGIIIWIVLVALNSCSTIHSSGTYRVEKIQGDTVQFSKYTWLLRDSTPVRGKYLIPGHHLQLKERIHISLTMDSINIFLIKK